MPQATDEQVAAWKAQHKVEDILEIHSDGYFGYLHKPDRKTLAACSAIQSNPVRSNELMLNSCWVGGDEILRTDNDYFMSVQGQLGQLIEYKAVEIKKR